MGAHLTLIYVGRRPRMVDPLYGTGEWARAEEGKPWPEEKAKRVPVEVARKMLKHPDVWVELEPIPVDHPAASTHPPVEEYPAMPDEIPTVEPKAPVDETEMEEAQKVRDSIAAMDSKQAIADFISANYAGYKIDKRASLDTIKQEAILVVDQFGVTP